MPKESVHRYSCDLCKQERAETSSNSEPPLGWVTIGHENYQCDRDFFDTSVCRVCVAKLKAAFAKQELKEVLK